MGFYLTIKNTYGVAVAADMKRWSSYNRKLANALNRRIFLLRCRSSRIVPNHIINNFKNLHNSVINPHGRITGDVVNFITALEFKTLNLEIKTTCNNIKFFKQNINNLQSQVKNVIPDHIFIEFERTLTLSFNKQFNLVKNKNISKFQRLQDSLPSNKKLFTDNSNWFKNLSDIEIPKDISDFLSLGPKFSITPVGNNVNINNFLADVESIIDVIPQQEKNTTRAKITNNITNFLTGTADRGGCGPLGNMYNKTKAFLKNHPNLYILQADKGGCTVAMKKTDYVQKTEDLLTDTTTYNILKTDPTTKIQKEHNVLIKKLKNNNFISEDIAKKLTKYNSTTPKLYTLPKVHKPDVPVRPIVSSINSITYNLSHHLAEILASSFAERTEYNVKDTFTFVNSVSDLVLPDNYVLISLDVVSLFTNIPHELILKILEQNWELIEHHCSFSKNSFLESMKFILEKSYFTFNNKFYLQTFGVPMGSPISPILALIVLDDILDNITPTLPFRLPFIYKYVDDLITSVPSNMIQHTLNIFNAHNTHIQFTLEQETSQGVPFLDTRVIRTANNKIILNWYQKPTASGRYINYHSNHPLNQKYNTVIAMKNRIIHISDPKFLQDNLKTLRNIFANNGYPKKILNKLIYNSNFFDGPTDGSYPENITYKKLPYINKLTNQVVNHFKSYNHIRIAKYNTITLKTIYTNTKDKTPNLLKHNVVYKIPCKNCNGCYIGQTSQLLKHRITQHRSDCRIGKVSCALATHSIQLGHVFDYDGIKVLTTENDYRKRLFLEMAYINKYKNCINFKTDTDQLNIIYTNILNFNIK